MEYELTSQKLDNNTHLVKNKHTNEPVAILKRTGGYKRNEVKSEWHPDYKLLHPEVHENLLTRNFHKPHDSVSDAVSNITYISQDHAFGKNSRIDPIKTRYAGDFDTKTPYGQDTKGHKWHVLDDDGKHVASITSFHGPNQIHRESPVSVGWVKSFNDSVPDSVKEAANSKHGGQTLYATMNRIRYMMDNKGKEPRFVGTHVDPASKTKMFKTNLPPEEASKAYEEHLAKRLGNGYTFTRHGPTLFTAEKPAQGRYDRTYQHHVIAMPGQLHHIESSLHHPDYDTTTNKNKEVVESYMLNPNKRPYPLTLEEHLKAQRFLLKKAR
jgi:hypothetical protein